MDFRSEYTALHTDYAVHLSNNIADALRMPTSTLESVRFAALLHNVGKVSLPAPAGSIEDYDNYLRALYDSPALDVTKQILTDNVDEQILILIEESFLLLKCWTNGQPITFSPAPAAEVVALSYLMSNSLSMEMNVSYHHHPRLLAFLREKYKVTNLDDTILKTLETSFDKIIDKTQSSCSTIYDMYQKMMEEHRSLSIVLQHYNSKY